MRFILLFCFPFSLFAQVNIEFAVVKYNGGGDWYANPTSVTNLISFCNEELKMQIEPKYATVEIEDKEGSIRNVMWVCSLATNQEFHDDITGKKINKELVMKARAEQLGEVKKFQVYEKVPIQNCWNETGKDPVGTRWLTVNKGDDQNPEIRCRIVAQEFNTHKREDLFAATPRCH